MAMVLAEARSTCHVTSTVACSIASTMAITFTMAWCTEVAMGICQFIATSSY